MIDKWLGSPPSVMIPRLQSLLGDLQILASPNGYDGPADAVVIRNAMLVQRSVPCLIGEMSGHPHIKDGPGLTSELFYLDEKRKIARTLSRWYRFDHGLIG
ncbi:hypothetical protein HFO61_03805 [Rhizobium leguminosarum]|uniref:hypothetical protein n=1 Tax=Rhizobium leguminosarum TaxID=384 RepID=UPI001C94A4AC|nr:hypothetical protein [Rhizobium leguminosarum]MBY5545974.1 hypothetical protein [Rhizobium leguminosarum]